LNRSSALIIWRIESNLSWRVDRVLAK
jgi:hypothetical protein